MTNVNDLLRRRTGQPWLADRTIFLTRHGSHAYGTNIATSDEDFKGVAIPPQNYFYGYLERFEQAEFRHRTDGLDAVVYDIRKFIRLAADCNPSVIEVLFTAPGDHVIQTRLGEILLACRRSFLSKKAKHTFGGYAVSQLKRINTHHRWLRNPPKAAPTRADFGLPEGRSVISQDQLKAAQAMIRKQVEAWNVPMDEVDDAGKTALKERFTEALAEIKLVQEDLEHVAAVRLGFDDNFLELLDRERTYRNRVEEWRQYQSWLANRNEARADLERQHGYDTKHGMHLVRLLRMAREILETGEVIVKRPDAKELLAIRNGAWSYEQLLEYTEGLMGQLDTLYSTSNAVPTAPDRVALDRLCESLVLISMTEPKAFGKPWPWT